MSCVLLVDDDADGSEAIGRFLESEGHRVVQATNGRRALAVLTTARPDVVLLDLMMPQLDGIGFLRVLNGYFQAGSFPVVVLTGLAEGPKLQRARELGVRRIFRKGDFRLSDLLEYVAALQSGRP
jgi:CheY-like chemotaxis protein